MRGGAGAAANIPKPAEKADASIVLSEDDARSKLSTLGIDEGNMIITSDGGRTIRSMVAKYFRYVTSATIEEALQAMGEDSSGPKQTRFERFLTI